MTNHQQTIVEKVDESAEIRLNVSLKCVVNESQPGSTFSSPADTQNDLNNKISFNLVQSLFCCNPQIHGSEPSSKKS